MFFQSYWQTAQQLPDDDRLKFFEGCCRFVFDGEYPEYERGTLLGIAYTMALPNIQQSVAINEAKREAGKRGGRPKKQEENQTENHS